MELKYRATIVTLLVCISLLKDYVSPIIIVYLSIHPPANYSLLLLLHAEGEIK